MALFTRIRRFRIKITMICYCIFRLKCIFSACFIYFYIFLHFCNIFSKFVWIFWQKLRFLFYILIKSHIFSVIINHKCDLKKILQIWFKIQNFGELKTMWNIKCLTKNVNWKQISLFLLSLLNYFLEDTVNLHQF